MHLKTHRIVSNRTWILAYKSSQAAIDLYLTQRVVSQLHSYLNNHFNYLLDVDTCRRDTSILIYYYLGILAICFAIDLH